MSHDKDRKAPESPRYSPFWVCFLVFLLVGGDYALRLVSLLNQRDQLNEATLMQAQNLGALAQARQLEGRLEGFSMDLLQIAKTNATARQIVQEFNIQWTPGPAPVPTTTAAPAVAAPVSRPPTAAEATVSTNK